MRKQTKPTTAPPSTIACLPQLPLPDDRLAFVPPGPDVLLSPSATSDIEEWIAGWTASAELEAQAIRPPGPLFMHGEPGTGKTAVTMMIAARFAGVRSVVVVDAMRVTERYIGATSANIAKAAEAAARLRSVIVLEEIDTLASNRTYDSAAEVENTRSTTTIMRVLELGGPIVLTSNRIDIIDPAVIRRCEYILEMPMPTPAQRRAILTRELGSDPGEVTLPLASAIPLARRARRLSVLKNLAPSDAFDALVKAKGGR